MRTAIYKVFSLNQTLVIMKIIRWSVMAFYAAFMLRLMWQQAREVWALAAAGQSATLDDWPFQWWGEE